MAWSLVARFLVVLLLLDGAPLADAAQLPAQFTTEREAQRHCPDETVVWLNLPTGVYHLKGTRWYGNTKHGVYVCEKEADQAGDRASKNGQ
jgi:hypothetical protein